MRLVKVGHFFLVALSSCVSTPSGQTLFEGVFLAPGASGAQYHVGGIYTGSGDVAITLTVGGRLTEIQELGGSASLAFTTTLQDSAQYAIGVVTQDQSCDITPATGQVQAADVDLRVRCGVRLQFTDGQAASVVLGQPDFTSSSTQAAAADTLNGPAGLWYDYDQWKLYVADSGNNRVVGFKNRTLVQVPRAATFYLGQTDLMSAAAGDTSSTLQQPSAVWSDSAVLVVADEFNNRVLLFTPFPAGDGLAPAAFALGQSTLAANGAACGPSAANHPRGVSIVNGRVLVADALNNRVLIWNTMPQTTGQAPDIVLGQPDANSCAAASQVSASTLASPSAVWTDGERVAVADSGNNRVLIWKTFPVASAQPADVVIGQTDMSQSAAGCSALALSRPIAVHSNNLQLFVGDAGNQRVLVWDAFPLVSGSPADAVLGQPSMTDAGAHVTATGLSEPAGFDTHLTQLTVTDKSANRIMIYASQSPTY